jgi:hypothetical protein
MEVSERIIVDYGYPYPPVYPFLSFSSIPEKHESRMKTSMPILCNNRYYLFEVFSALINTTLLSEDKIKAYLKEEITYLYQSALYQIHETGVDIELKGLVNSEGNKVLHDITDIVLDNAYGLDFHSYLMMANSPELFKCKFIKVKRKDENK